VLHALLAPHRVSLPACVAGHADPGRAGISMPRRRLWAWPKLGPGIGGAVLAHGRSDLGAVVSRGVSAGVNMSESVRLLCYWLGLAALTLATVNLAGAEIRSGIAVAVVALAVAKAWLIIDGFMEL